MSALLGQAPLNQNDIYILKGLYIISPSAVNPNKSQPLGTPAPPDAPHDSHSKSLIIGESFAILFVIFFTLARLYARRFRSHYWGADDWVIIPGAIRQIQESLFYFTVFTIKLSIALANRRITGMVAGTWRYIHWTFIGVFICLLPITTFLNMLQCLPVPAGYSLWYDEALKDPYIIKCVLNRQAIRLGTRILHILTDFSLLCVPIFIVARLHMPKAKKYRLIAIFAVGGMSTISSVVRNILIVRYMDDFTYQSYYIYCFDVMDITFTCIVASLPALNGLLEVLLRSIKFIFTSLTSGSLFTSRMETHDTASTSHLGSSAGPYQRADDELVRQTVWLKETPEATVVNQFEMDGY